MGEGPKDLRSGSATTKDHGGSASADTAMLRAEIEQTRTEIGETLDEIQGRLHPRRLVSQATETVREAAAQGLRQARTVAGSAANQVADSTRGAATRTYEHAREHPWSAAAAAAGVGAAAWWLATRRHPADDDWDSADAEWDAVAVTAADEVDMSEEGLYRDFGDDFIYAEEEGIAPLVAAGAAPILLGGLAIGWWLWSRRRKSAAEEPWNGGYGSAGADAGSYRTFGERRWHDEETPAGPGVVRRTVSDVASRARDMAASAGERTRDAAGRAQREMSERGRTAANRAVAWVDENPLGAGFVALCAGLLIGLAIPESDRERRAMGRARSRLIASARRAGRDAVGRVRDTVTEAAAGPRTA